MLMEKKGGSKTMHQNADDTQTTNACHQKRMHQKRRRTTPSRAKGEEIIAEKTAPREENIETIGPKLQKKISLLIKIRNLINSASDECLKKVTFEHNFSDLLR